MIKKYETCQIGLENVLSSQRYSSNKCGIHFSNFDKSSASQTIFVKAIGRFNNKDSNKLHVINHCKRPHDRNKFYLNKRNRVFRPTCSYCNTKGHTLKACYIRNYNVPYGEYVWVKKGTNLR